MKNEIKKKRVKKVFSSSSQVYHLWANQSQDDARQGGRITRAFFSGKAAYSYGHHYCVGRILEYKGVQLAIVNNSGYSNTTSKHIREAYYAASDLMPVLKAQTFDVFDALIENQSKLIDELMSLFNRRTFWGDFHLEVNSYILKEITKFNKTAKALKHPELVISGIDEIVELINEHAKACKARKAELQSPENLAKKELARQKRAQADAVKNEASVQAWREGGAVTNYIRDLSPQLVRINGTKVETSRGAEVPIADAMKLLRAIESGKANNGDAVGSFTFHHVNGNIAQIGCHRINLDEARRALGERTTFRIVQGLKA